MLTMREYFYKSLKNFALILASIIVLVLVWIAIDWFLPRRFHNGLVLASVRFAKQIGLTLLLGILVFFGYKAFKIFKTAESPSQEFFKMTPTVIIWLVVVFLVGMLIGGQRGGADCRNNNYNEKLNGGVKVFDGKKYTINICGSGVNNSPFFGDGMEAVQLTVLNEHGALLARRRYKVFWDGKPGHEPIGIEKDKLTYYDDEDQDGPRSVTMPPTWLDWIRARLLFVD